MLMIEVDGTLEAIEAAAEAISAAARGEDRRVDTDEFAAQIHECAARVAWIDRGIGLDQLAEPAAADTTALDSADDSQCSRLSQSEGIADGDYEVADLQPVRVAERQRTDGDRWDLQDR